MSLHHNRIGSFAGRAGGAPLIAAAGLAALLTACTPASCRAEEALSNAPVSTDVFARAVPLMVTATESKGGQLGLIPKPFPLHLRLGLMLSPRTKFDGGLDATLGRGILPSLSTRVDVDAIVSANFHGISTLVPATLDQVYSKGLLGGNRLYFERVSDRISRRRRVLGANCLSARIWRCASESRAPSTSRVPAFRF